MKTPKAFYYILSALIMGLAACGKKPADAPAADADKSLPAPTGIVINSYWDSVLTAADSLSPCMEDEVSETIIPVEHFDPSNSRPDAQGFINVKDDYCLLQKIMKGHYLHDPASPVRIYKSAAGTWLIKNLKPQDRSQSPVLIVLLKDRDVYIYNAQAEDQLDSLYQLKPEANGAGLLALQLSRQLYGSGGGMAGKYIRLLDLDQARWAANIPLVGSEEGFGRNEGEKSFKVVAQRPAPAFSNNGQGLRIEPAQWQAGATPAEAGSDYDIKDPETLFGNVFQDVPILTRAGSYQYHKGKYEPVAQ